MAKRLGAWSVDDTGVMKLTGFLETLSKDLGKSRNLNPVMKYVFQELDQAFTMHMSTKAVGQKARFHHVYEWNAVGVPKAKLWDSKLIGSGTSRAISFDWRASKTAVPLPKPLPPAGKQGQQLRGGHIFIWKAPMMEYAMDVDISPKLGDFLAFIANEIGEQPHRNGLWFSRGPERFDAPPNSRLAAGQFTAEFLSWWTGQGAERAFEGGIRKAVEQGISSQRIAADLNIARSNVSNKVTPATRAAAHKAGKKAALAFLEKKNTFYSNRLEISRMRGTAGRFSGG